MVNRQPDPEVLCPAQPLHVDGKKQVVDEGADGDENEKIDRTVTSGGLQIVCSSSIHDNLFRQVRQWARMGYTGAEIQAEFDARYQDILQQIYSVQQEVKKCNASELKLLGEGAVEPDLMEGK